MAGERACWLTHVYDPKATAAGEHVPGRKHFESPTSRSPADVEGSDGLPPGFIPPREQGSVSACSVTCFLHFCPSFGDLLWEWLGHASREHTCVRRLPPGPGCRAAGWGSARASQCGRILEQHGLELAGPRRRRCLPVNVVRRCKRILPKIFLVTPSFL